MEDISLNLQKTDCCSSNQTDLPDRMKQYTRADLLSMAKDARKQRLKYYVKGVYEEICEIAEEGEKTQHTTNEIFPQDLIEDAKVSLQQLFPDSKIEIVEKTFYVSKDERTIWNFLLAPKKPIEEKYRAIQIDWS